MRVVGIYLLNALFHIDKAYDYLLPDGMNASKGDIALIPFGKGDRREYGIVDSVREQAPTEGVALKTVDDVHSGLYAIGEELFELALHIKRTTLSTFGEAARLMLGQSILGAPHCEVADGTSRYRITLSDNVKYERSIIALSDTASLRAGKQREIFEYIVSAGECPESELTARFGAVAPQIRALAEKGLVRVRQQESYRLPYELSGACNTEDIVLSSAQTEAFEGASELISRGAPACALLFGVTGSGKTKVILRLIDDVLSSGKGVIMLVPEIALTPQTVSIFTRRYGRQVALIHSSLSNGERLDAYRRIKRGESRLVIGTRSAIFAPLDNIGLIVIDEEHEHTYKSDKDPKYHARDVASKRCVQNNAVLLLASATPSIESFYRARSGVYTLLTLKERYGGAQLPPVHIVDIREELINGNMSAYSRRLFSKIKKRKELGEQSILLLNRRGYNAYLHCKGCGSSIDCPNCSVSLTNHMSGSGSFLFCHICGYKCAVPNACPTCGGQDISYLGTGTQKAEAELSSLIPELRVLRMDADTVSKKSAYDDMLGAFRGNEYDTIVGTQMVAKGHDFPRVTLVGVLLADTSLHVNDFRASERTFALLTQVIGRAGRASKAGEAVIQTFKPNDEIIHLAATQDYESFYELEIARREQFQFPPFCDIVTLTVTADSESVVSDFSQRVADCTIAKAQASGHPFVIFGPVEALLYKAMGKYRKKLVIKTKLSSKARALLADILCEFSRDTRATLTIDINPTNT